MTKITKIFLTLIVSVFVLASCMKTDETETTSECAILTFSVSDIKSAVTVHRSTGVDTTITKTVSGSSIYFNIDQLKGTITTVDSVANWVNLNKVVPSFTSYGYVYGRVSGDSLYYQWTSGSDSINFEKPIDVMVVSTNGTSTKHYTLSIKRSAYALDTINWSKVTNDCKITDECKTLELNNTVYAFFKNAEGKVQVTSSSTNTGLSKWSTPQNIEGSDIDYSSLLTFNNTFYALGKDGLIYKINNGSNSYSAEKTNDKIFTNLLAADSYYIYATDGKQILCSEDFNTWTTCGTNDINMLPTSCCKTYSYQSKTNSNIQICMMNGLSANNSKNAVCWYKISSKKTDINQNWMYIQVTDDNKYGLPKLNNLSTTMLNGSLYAIGTKSDGKYKNIYESDDNGITWHSKDIYPLPTDLLVENGNANLIGADGKLWIIQKNGDIWSGVIR